MESGTKALANEATALYTSSWVYIAVMGNQVDILVDTKYSPACRALSAAPFWGSNLEQPQD